MGVTTSSKSFWTYVTQAGYTHFCESYAELGGR